MANAELEFFVHTSGARPQVIHAAPGDIRNRGESRPCSV
jgi:hypothetical protein